MERDIMPIVKKFIKDNKEAMDELAGVDELEKIYLQRIDINEKLANEYETKDEKYNASKYFGFRNTWEDALTFYRYFKPKLLGQHQSQIRCPKCNIVFDWTDMDKKFSERRMFSPIDLEQAKQEGALEEAKRNLAKREEQLKEFNKNPYDYDDPILLDSIYNRELVDAKQRVEELKRGL